MRFIILVFVFFFQVLNPHIFCQHIIPTNRKAMEIVNRQSPQLEPSLKLQGLNLGSNVYLRIFKESEELELWVKKDNIFSLYKTYKICTYGPGGLGPKIKRGDNQAPEGFYQATAQSLNPNSNYHLAIGVGYPNEYDRRLKRTGSAIMIHGDCASIGCFAMTNLRIEKIYALVYCAFKNGQDKLHIDIFPFRMTNENLNMHQNSEWQLFWRNLKEGYDFFEMHKTPPKVRVKNGKYIFSQS